jgi:hypothetical protein
MAKKLPESFNPEKYMQMAIDAMNNSIDEPRTDGKVSPKVGAVLIKPDGTVESTSRAELRFRVLLVHLLGQSVQALNLITISAFWRDLLYTHGHHHGHCVHDQNTKKQNVTK